MSKLNCPHFQASRCQSCQWIDQDIASQVETKELHLREIFPSLEDHIFLDTVQGPISHFRNKAKMVALGAAHAPILGIQNHNGESVSLVDCPLYSNEMQDLLQGLEKWIQQAGIPPYQIHKQKGELKYILISQNRLGQFMVRLVLRSLERQSRIKERLPILQEAFPQIKVITLNIQPEHKAILEGEQEIYLTQDTFLVETLNEVPLAITAGGFFQTNTVLAEKLYQTSSDWAVEQHQKGNHFSALNKTSTQDSQDLSINKTSMKVSIWDLFCGVGGFGLSLAHHFQKSSIETQLTGIEISPEAIEAAKWSAQSIGLNQVHFQAVDTLLHQHDLSQHPDILIVNPPRRGIGPEMCSLLEKSQAPTIIYSSCNALTLQQDTDLLPSYEILKLQIFDLFPHTSHFETLCLLQRKNSPGETHETSSEQSFQWKTHSNFKFSDNE